MKKRSLFLTMILVLTLVLSACGQTATGGDAAKEKEYNLKMSVTVGESSTWFEAAEKLAADLEEETDGRIKMEVYPNEQLSGGDSGKGVELLVKGSTDLSFHSTIIYSILDERLGVVSAPFLFKDLNEVDTAFNGEPGEAIKEILRKKGIETLGFGQNGFRQLTNSKVEAKTSDELKGLKVRIPGITMYTDLWTQLGANPTAMTFSEVFTSLQQGTIDGQENPIDVIHSAKLNEVQDYITMWNYSYDPLVLGINKKTLESMSQEDQELIKKLGAEAAAYQVELAREKEAKQIEELEAAGMQFYYPSEDDLKDFSDAVQPIYEKYESVWGEDLLNAFLSK
ncbi:DctP family TRAP transporter solute-binding subunit [Robertmurraya sp. P23]|uniref:DctP family TRAP transporter solute-binding subunit n=1 Tax=Robertmurraya sp. P23 TaxID=3436931 RepID=UPI003D979FB0